MFSFKTKKIIKELKEKKDIEGLIKLMQNKPKAAEVLGEIGDICAVEPLIEALKNENSALRKKAAAALGEIKDIRATKPLITALRDKKCGVREEAALALGKIKAPLGVQPLINIIKSEKWISVKKNACWSLGEIGDPQAIEFIITAWKDDSFIEKYAKEALRKIKDPCVVVSLIAAMKIKKISIRQNALIELIIDMDKIAIEPLLIALKDKEPDIRRSVVDMLGKLKNFSAIDPLISALKDDDIYVRRHATEALGKIRDIRAVKPLINAFNNEPEPFGIVWALGEIRDTRAVIPLIDALKNIKNTDWYFRGRLAEALGKIKDPRAIEPLITIMEIKDTERTIRFGLAKGYELIYGESIAGHNINTLKGKYLFAQELIAKALEELTGKNFGQDFIEWRKWWEENKKNFLKGV